MSKKDLEYYRRLPYTRVAHREFDESAGRPYWVAEIEELPGCKADGVQYAEAMANLDAAFDDYIEAKLAWETEIPEPHRPHPAQRKDFPLPNRRGSIRVLSSEERDQALQGAASITYPPQDPSVKTGTLEPSLTLVA